MTPDIIAKSDCFPWKTRQLRLFGSCRFLNNKAKGRWNDLKCNSHIVDVIDTLTLKKVPAQQRDAEAESQTKLLCSSSSPGHPGKEWGGLFCGHGSQRVLPGWGPAPAHRALQEP